MKCEWYFKGLTAGMSLSDGNVGVAHSQIEAQRRQDCEVHLSEN